MKEQTSPKTLKETRKVSVITWKAMLRFVATTIVMLGILFISAGTFEWWVAWTYAALTLMILIGSRIILVLRNPDLAIERAEAGSYEDTKTWDKFLVPVTAIYGPIISWIIAGLDYRFGWSPSFPLGVQLTALVLLALGSLFGTWAMIENRFFSSHVRIQADRGHRVVDTGPYRIVRHPGYAGGLLSWIASPFFFGSWWVAVPSLIVIAATVLRTALEDRTLQKELTGYQDYTEQIRYRLIPGIW
jgi:protein-S-isoprenylcysteine O-methyltransferase Ste14